MAGASLLALIDDIAAILDDVATMTKVAAGKTAGVLGDDLALNAQQVAGVRAERELPVVWAVAVGSLKNKLILVPAALTISALLPSAVMPLLMLGGLYLCLEGFEKLAEQYAHDDTTQQAEQRASQRAALADEQGDLASLEAAKIKGAIRTDFVLSAEIVVIALGAVAQTSFLTQVAVLSAIALLMTAGVYGVVAGIVKLDDFGLYLLGRSRGSAQTLGRMLLLTAPLLMKALTVIGTAAMFLVGGSILTHGYPPLHQAIDEASRIAGALSTIGGVLRTIAPALLDVVVGIVAGAATLLGLRLLAALRGRPTP